MWRFFYTKQLRPVQILHQRLDGFTFRVSHLLNEAQVIPREDLRGLKKRNISCLFFCGGCCSWRAQSTCSRIPMTFLLFALDSPKVLMLKAQIFRQDVMWRTNKPSTNSTARVLIFSSLQVKETFVQIKRRSIHQLINITASYQPHQLTRRLTSAKVQEAVVCLGNVSVNILDVLCQ